MPDQAMQEKTTVEESFLGNFSPLKSLCEKYDAFQDLPFSHGVNYAVVDSMFPGSKFILTVRDSEAWFDSLVRFHIGGILKMAGVGNIDDFCEKTFEDKNIYLKKNYVQNIMKKLATSVVNYEAYYDWSLVYDKSYRINLYESRNNEIIKYFFNRREQLLVFDVSKEKDNSKIVDFLGFNKSFVVDLPHLNKGIGQLS
jgi:hypothetical protein